MKICVKCESPYYEEYDVCPNCGHIEDKRPHHNDNGKRFYIDRLPVWARVVVCTAALLITFAGMFFASKYRLYPRSPFFKDTVIEEPAPATPPEEPEPAAVAAVLPSDTPIPVEPATEPEEHPAEPETDLEPAEISEQAEDPEPAHSPEPTPSPKPAAPPEPAPSPAASRKVTVTLEMLKDLYEKYPSREAAYTAFKEFYADAVLDEETFVWLITAFRALYGDEAADKVDAAHQAVLKGDYDSYETAYKSLWGEDSFEIIFNLIMQI